MLQPKKNNKVVGLPQEVEQNAARFKKEDIAASVKQTKNSAQLDAGELNSTNLSGNTSPLSFAEVDSYIDKQHRQFQTELDTKEAAKIKRLSELNETEKIVLKHLGDEKTLEYLDDQEKLNKLNDKHWTNRLYDVLKNTIILGNPFAKFDEFRTARSDAEDKKYDELVEKQRQTLSKPILDDILNHRKQNLKKLDELGAKLDKQNKEAFDKYGFFGNDPDAKRRDRENQAYISRKKAIQDFSKADIENIETYLKNGNGVENVWAGLYSQRKELGTVGLNSLSNDYQVYQAKKNVDKGVATEADNLLLQVYGKNKQLEATNLMRDSWGYRIGQGTAHSLTFVESMALTGGLGGAVETAATKGSQQLFRRGLSKYIQGQVSKSVLRGAIKGATIGAKAVGGVASVGAQALISPMTYQGFLDKKNKNIEIVTDDNGNEILLVGKAYTNYYTKIYKQNIAELQKQLSETNSEDEKTKLRSEIQRLEDEKGSFQEVGDGRAFLYGMTESMKEMLAEKYVGEGFDKLGGLVINSKLARKLAETMPGKSIKSLSESVKQFKKQVAETELGKLGSKLALHTGQGKLIHSLPAEVVEEIAVQLTPTLDGDYKQQFNELTKGSFYADVIAQTLLMKGITGGPSAIANFKNIKKLGEYRNLQQSVRQTYDHISNAVNDDALAEHIAMNTGGTGFEIAEYNRKVNELRLEGKNEEADKLEQKKFFNLASIAASTNTLGEFNKSLDKVIQNNDLSAETRKNAILAKENIDVIQKIYDKHKDAPNIHEIIEHASQKVTNKQSMQELDVELGKLQSEANDEVERVKKMNGFEDINHSMTDLFTKTFDNKEDQDKYDSFLDALENDNSSVLKTYANLTLAKATLQNAHYDTMRKFNESITEEHIQKFQRRNELHKNFLDTIDKIESGKLVIPNLSFDANNKIELQESNLEYIRKELSKKFNKSQDVDLLNNLMNQVSQDIRLKKVYDEVQRIQNLQSNIDAFNQEASEIIPDEITEETSLLEYEDEHKDDNQEEDVFDNSSVEEDENKFSEGLNNNISNIANVDKEVSEETVSLYTIGNDGIAVANNGVINDEDIIEPHEEMLPARPYTTQQIATLKNNVRQAVENIEDKLGRQPSFSEMMKQMYKYASDKKQVEKVFDHMVKGWVENNYPGEDFEKIRNELFNPFREDVNNLLDSTLDLFQIEEESTTGRVEQASNDMNSLDDLTEKVEVEVLNNNQSIVALDEENTAVTKTEVDEIQSKRTLTIQPKIGFNAVTYSENIIDGVFSRNANSNELNISEDSLIDFRDLLNYEKYKSGDKLNVEIAPENLWSKINVSNGRDSKGNSITISFDEYVKAQEKTNPNYRQTQAFIDKVPMFFTDNTGKRLGYVHDVSWYNPFNISNPFGKENNPNNVSDDWNNYILKGQEQVRSLRNNINKGLKEVTLTFPSEGVFHKITIDENLPTINENNPHSQLAVQIGDTLMIGNKPFNGVLLNSNSRGDIGKFDLKDDEGRNLNGNTWWIARTGNTTNDKGEIVPAHRAYPLLRTVNKDQIETARWALAAYLTLNGYEVNNPDYKMSHERALKIQADINKSMRMNIENIIEVTNFMKMFFQTKENGDNINQYRKILFKTNNPLLHVSQHTLNQRLDSKHPVVHIDNTGTVKVVSNNYEQYLKDNLYTNIKSFNVSSESNPVYATVVQPIITVSFNEINDDKPEIEKIQEKVETEKQVERTPVTNLQSHIDFLNSIGVNITSFESNDMMIGNTDKLANIFNVIGNLSVLEEKSIRQYIVHNIAEKIDVQYKSKKSKKEVMSEIKSDLIEKTNLIKSQIELLNNDLDLINDPRVETIKLAYSHTLANMTTIIGEFNSIFDKAFEDVSKESKLVISEDKTIDDKNNNDDLVEKDYNRESIEETGKSKVSYALRRFLHKIPKYENGKIKSTYLGLPDYMSFNEAYNELIKVLSAGSDVRSDFNYIINKLENSKLPFTKDILNKLKDADEQVKNAFVTNFTRHTLQSKFSMYEKSKDGVMLKVYETNANESNRQIVKIWKNNNRASDLYNNDLTINVEKAKSLLTKFNSFDEDYTKVNNQELRSWLQEFGFTFQNETWEEIYKNGIYNSNKQTSFELLYKQDKGGLFKNLVNFLTNAIESPEKFQYDKIDIFTDLNNVTKSLANIEAQYNGYLVSTTFRDSGKSISTQVPTKFVTDKINDLKDSLVNPQTNSLIEDLQSISFSKNSLILDLLQNDPAFKNHFSISHTSLNVVKERNSKKNPNSITELSELDYDLAVLTGFMDRKLGELSSESKLDGFSLRLAEMLFPAMSDKTTGLYLKTAVLDLMKDSNLAFTKNFNGDTVMSDDLKEILYNQLVLPELERIVNFHKNVKSTNIKNYDKGAVIFHLIPKLNTLMDQEQNVSIIKSLALNTNYSLDYVNERYKEQFKNALEEVIVNEVENKKQLWQQHVNDNGESLIFNKDYFDKVNRNQKDHFDIAVYDFVVNSMLHNSEVFKVFAGDVSNYSQDKLFKENKVSVDSYALENTDKYISINREIGINLGKRLALLIAPGNKIANSHGEKYNQIFLADTTDISENAEYLISLFYGKEALTKEVSQKLVEYKQNEKLISKYEEGQHTNVSTEELSKAKNDNKLIRDYLSNKFKDIDAYFDIESTDAQEYTTIGEHLSILKRLGRITSEQANTIEQKIKNAELTNTDLHLTRKELGLVFQPIKPVHTGTYINKDFDINRVVYVKSSSFPLIPQLTKGTKLDNLRIKMEELEKTTGRFTRASYQTANKVGAVKDTNTINPFDTNSLNDIKEYAENDLKSSVLILDRNNFRVQQDVPFKSEKHQDDVVSMGTQFFKLLFGDGMLDVSTPYVIDNKEYTGKELYEHFNKSFASLIDAKKGLLFNELGLNSDGTYSDETTFISKLQDLLVKEATGRGYSRKSLTGLTIEQLANKAGNYYEFVTPLWLSTDSNKYESLLNAIITNRLMKHKLPGNGFVAGSESGFRFKSNLDGIDSSKIIYLDSWNGEELQGTKIVDGKLQKAQVFVPSKFKNDKHELIDLFEDFSKETREGKYIYTRENGTLGLKEGMIDVELFNNFSFRTPTSSHVSGSSIEIAGILPVEVGDLMIVPKNFTKQKGLDYDIDKESAYQLNHYVDHNGKIKVLNVNYVNSKINSIQKLINELHHENTIIERKSDIFNQLKSLFNEEDFIEEIKSGEIQYLEKKLENVKLTYQKKLAENEFIRTHLAVFNNADNDVQNKINKVLSIDFAKEQASAIEEFNEEGKKNKMIQEFVNQGFTLSESEEKVKEKLSNFSMLHYSYQKSKLDLGSIGKIAIGVYANYTTFNGLLQQNKEADIHLIDTVNGEKSVITIGNFTSDGSLGLDKSISPNTNSDKWIKNHQRTIAEVFAEKENTATDNEKEQVLGRVGVNEFTINVDALLTLRGFDKDENGNSISYMLLSQPIIKRLNEKKKESKGILGNFTTNDELILSVLNEFNINMLPNETNGEILTGDNLLDGIKNNGSNNEVQAEALRLYLQLEEEAKGVSFSQKVINTNDLGKSIIESSLKYKDLQNLNSTNVKNVELLLGEFSKDKIIGGYKIGDLYIKPTTPQGQIVIHGLQIGNTMYNRFFPYENNAIQTVFDSILNITNKENLSNSSKIEIYENVLKDIKKYIYSRKNNNVFDLSNRAKRYELFIDDLNNMSLSTYLQKLVNKEFNDNKKGVNHVLNNVLIKHFTYTKGKLSDELSLIEFNNTSADNTEEDSLYNSIPELIINNYPLPNRNGKPYSTSQLAQDLVAYSFLEGGIQEASQFVKFIPTEYLQSAGQMMDKKTHKDGEVTIEQVFVPINRKLQEFSKSNINHDTLFNRLLLGEDGKLFIQQYFQHNPTLTPFVFSLSVSKAKTDNTFYIKSKSEYVYTVDITNELVLYKKIRDGVYTTIPVLGKNGINEYEAYNPNVIPLNEDVVNEVVDLSNSTNLGSTLNITENMSYLEILDNISKSNLSSEYEFLKEVAKNLMPFVKQGQGKLLFSDKINGAGQAGRNTLNITLNPNETTKVSDEITASTFIHEFVHTITANELLNYIEENGEFKQGITIPSHVLRLVKTFNYFKKHIGKELSDLETKIQNNKDNALAPSKYTDRELYYVYGAKNIREFIAVALTSPMFAEEANKIAYEKTDKSLWEQLKDSIVSLVKSIFKNVSNDTLAEASLLASLDFINTEYNIRIKNSQSLAAGEQYQVEQDEQSKILFKPLDKKTDENEKTDKSLNNNRITKEEILNLPDCI